MKSIIIILAFVACFHKNAKAQEHVNPEGLDRFVGFWKHINGQDSILLRSYSIYVTAPGGSIRGLVFYYDYKRGANYIYHNLQNFGLDGKGDFAGTRPTNYNNIDTLKITGSDMPRRKLDEGYLILNTTTNQLTFKRDIGIFGGGSTWYEPGQQPLPGYTLPATITFNKVVFEEAKGN